MIALSWCSRFFRAKQLDEPQVARVRRETFAINNEMVNSDHCCVSLSAGGPVWSLGLHRKRAATLVSILHSWSSFHLAFDASSSHPLRRVLISAVHNVDDDVVPAKRVEIRRNRCLTANTCNLVNVDVHRAREQNSNVFKCRLFLEIMLMRLFRLSALNAAVGESYLRTIKYAE